MSKENEKKTKMKLEMMVLLMVTKKLSPNSNSDQTWIYDSVLALGKADSCQIL